MRFDRSVGEFEVNGRGNGHAVCDLKGFCDRGRVRFDVADKAVAAGADHVVVDEDDGVRAILDVLKLDLDDQVRVVHVHGLLRIRRVVVRVEERNAVHTKTVVASRPFAFGGVRVVPIPLHTGFHFPDEHAVNVEFGPAVMDDLAVGTVRVVLGILLHVFDQRLHVEAEADAVPTVFADRRERSGGHGLVEDALIGLSRSEIVDATVGGFHTRTVGLETEVSGVGASGRLVVDCIEAVQIFERTLVAALLPEGDQRDDRFLILVEFLLDGIPEPPVVVGERLVPEDRVLKPEVVPQGLLLGRIEVLLFGAGLVYESRDVERTGAVVRVAVGNVVVGLRVEDLGRPGDVLFNRGAAERADAALVPVLIEQVGLFHGPGLHDVFGGVRRDLDRRAVDDRVTDRAVIGFRACGAASLRDVDRVLGIGGMPLRRDLCGRSGDHLVANRAVIRLRSRKGAGGGVEDRGFAFRNVGALGRSGGGVGCRRLLGGCSGGCVGDGRICRRGFVGLLAAGREREDAQDEHQNEREGSVGFLHNLFSFLLSSLGGDRSGGSAETPAPPIGHVVWVIFILP